jgi:hypothetical protein
MTGTRIHITGGGTDHHDSMVGLQSRIVFFPDNIPRHITMTNWQWEVYDRTHAEIGVHYLSGAAFELALRIWLEESFNVAAGTTNRRVLRDPAVRESVAMLESSSPDTVSFDAHLRYALGLMIRVNMPAAAGRDAAANDHPG